MLLIINMEGNKIMEAHKELTNMDNRSCKEIHRGFMFHQMVQAFKGSRLRISLISTHKIVGGTI